MFSARKKRGKRSRTLNPKTGNAAICQYNTEDPAPLSVFL